MSLSYDDPDPMDSMEPTPAEKVRNQLMAEFTMELSRFETAHEAEVLAALHKQTHYSNYHRAKATREVVEVQMKEFLARTFDQMIRSSK